MTPVSEERPSPTFLCHDENETFDTLGTARFVGSCYFKNCCICLFSLKDTLNNLNPFATWRNYTS